MVFVMSLGYFVTPALLGGTANMMLAELIAQFVQSLVNWGHGRCRGLRAAGRRPWRSMRCSCASSAPDAHGRRLRCCSISTASAGWKCILLGITALVAAFLLLPIVFIVAALVRLVAVADLSAARLDAEMVPGAVCRSALARSSADQPRDRGHGDGPVGADRSARVLRPGARALPRPRDPARRCS